MMGLDSSLFAGQIAAQAYAVGDIVPLGCIRGPQVVRAGYGAAILKKVFTETNTTSASFRIVIKNSNWVDPMSNIGTVMTETSLDDNSMNIQRGHDCDLVPNSSWQVYAECIAAGTETAASMVFALIDVDYPSVSSIINPRLEKGYPTSIDVVETVTVTAATAAPSAIVWNTFNVDIFKAGYRYLLAQASVRCSSASAIAFLEISGAAGQSGLTRIIPCRASSVAGIRYLIDYSTPLVKGPMNLTIAAVGTSGSDSAYIAMDWVKR